MNIINGSSGNDSLTGTSGDDYLNGGAGADTMQGMSGDDVYIVDDPLDVVVENPGEGTDRVNSTIDFSLGANVEGLWLVGTASVSGVGNELGNTLWGNSGNNKLTGLAGDDFIDGGTGADTMIGGTGNDTYYVDDAGDIVTENPGEGIDTVYSSVADFILPSNVENLYLISGKGNINGTGNGLDNYITGNEGNNQLLGLGGNDTLNGGAGADMMVGGSGNDTYYVDNAGDSVIENPNEGNDTVISTLANYSLSANVENLTLGLNYSDTSPLNGTGNELDNTLRGNSGNNILLGGGGDDTLIGGSGNDTLTGGTGNDTFYISTADTGTDAITDLSSGDIIEICGAVVLSGAVTSGNGTFISQGQVQLDLSGGNSILYVGTDTTPGADLVVNLNGTYETANFQLSGFDIIYSTNHAPVLNIPVADQQATVGSAFNLILSSVTFTDADGDPLSYSAMVADIDWGYLDLPSWLHFDPATRTFSGTPTDSDIGDTIITLIATDSNGATGDSSFNLHVTQSSIPTVAIADDTPGTATGVVNYSLSFSQSVSGLTADDFIVANGTIKSISGSGSNYSISVSPNSAAEGEISFTIKAGAVTTSGGKLNAESSAVAQPFDTKIPALTTVTINNHSNGSPFIDGIVLTFSEAIKQGNGKITLKDETGTPVEVYSGSSSSNLSVNGSILTIKPTSTTLPGTNGYKLEIASGAVMDLAGNAYAADQTYDISAKVDSSFSGGVNNDSFRSLAGNDLIDGGTGLDTVIYGDSYTSHRITRTADGIIVSGGVYGTDTLRNVERLKFADTSVALDITGVAGASYRLYQAAFNRTPDYSGLGYWIAQMDKGVPIDQISACFVDSNEFHSLYGNNLPNESYVTRLYNNVLHRAPEQAGYNWWLNALDNGAISRGQLLSAFGESQENQLQVFGVISDGIVYTAWPDLS